MTAHALVTGVLYRQPEQRMAKTGKPFVVATLKAMCGDGAQWWKVIVFSESAGAELMRLGDGDAVSVQGAMKAELYRPEGGEPRLSLSVVADQILALRQPPRQRERKTVERQPALEPLELPLPLSRRERCTGVAEPMLNDDVPF
jgi:single-stranded DNA-binding protein